MDDTDRGGAGLSERLPKLYEIAGAYEAVAAELIERDGELTPELEAAIDAADADLTAKVRNIVRLIRNLEAEQAALSAMADVYNEEMARLEHREKQRAATVLRLKEYTKRCLEHAGIRKVDAPDFSVRVQENARPVITWAGKPEDLPEAFRKPPAPYVPKLDADAALRAYRDNKLPAGFNAETGTHLRIS